MLAEGKVATAVTWNKVLTKREEGGEDTSSCKAVPTLTWDRLERDIGLQVGLGGHRPTTSSQGK